MKQLELLIMIDQEETIRRKEKVKAENRRLDFNSWSNGLFDFMEENLCHEKQIQEQTKYERKIQRKDESEKIDSNLDVTEGSKTEEDSKEEKSDPNLAEFKLTTSDKADIEQVFNSLSSLVEEITIQITQEGLIIRTMDASHVALIDVKWPNSAFEKYEVTKEGKFAVRIEEIQKVIKLFEKKDSVSLEVDEYHMLKIFNRDVTMKIRLIESSATDTPIPQIPFDSSFEVTSKDLIKKLRKIQAFSDYVTIDTTETKVSLSGKGDIGEINTEYEKGTEDLIDLNVKQNSKSTYSLEYLMPFLLTVKDLQLELGYSTAKPIRITARFSNIGTIQMYLAPRVEE